MTVRTVTRSRVAGACSIACLSLMFGGCVPGRGRCPDDELLLEGECMTTQEQRLSQDGGLGSGACEGEGCKPDCNGDRGGDAVEDMCGVCDDDPDNDCVQDCHGAWGRGAIEDMCGICDDDPDNDCQQDCDGEWGGEAFVDDCGWCDANPDNDNTSCEQDCAGTWAGGSTMDVCGVCNDDPDDNCVITPSVSCANNSCCMLDRQGKVVCWGQVGNGQPLVAPVETVFRQISLGPSHACGVGVDWKVRCWGDSEKPRSMPPTDVEFTMVSSGSAHTCGLRRDNANAECWGDDANGRATAPRGVAFIDLSAGVDHSCAVQQIDNQIQCWGFELYGRTLAPKERFRSVAVGTGHSCGLRLDGAIECWGAGQEGDSGGLDQGQSIVPGGINFVGLSTGHIHTCAINDADGRVNCWGDPISRGGSEPDLAFFDVTSGDAHNCGLEVGTDAVHCWGNDLYDQLSDFGP